MTNAELHPTFSRPPEYEEIRFLSGDAPMTLSIWKAGKSAPCLVFYPGTMASPLLYVDLLQRLHALGFTVLGIHHLSHGKSPRLKKNFTFADLLQNGLDAVSYALERFEGPVVLTGHSQGGVLSLAQAGLDTRLAAVFPHCFLLPQRPEAIEVTRLKHLAHRRETFMRLLGKAAALLPRFPVVIPMYLDLRRIFAGCGTQAPPTRSWRASLRHTRLSYPLCYVYSLFSADLGYLCEEGNIVCPVFALAAEDDALFTPALLRGMLADVRAGHKELILLSCGGHMAPFNPNAAAEIASIIKERCAGLGLFAHPAPFA